MKQQPVNTTGISPSKTLKANLQVLKSNATEVKHALKQDYQEIVSSLRNLHTKSRVRTFLQAKFKKTTTTLSPEKPLK